MRGGKFQSQFQAEGVLHEVRQALQARDYARVRRIQKANPDLEQSIKALVQEIAEGTKG